MAAGLTAAKKGGEKFFEGFLGLKIEFFGDIGKFDNW